MKKLLVKGILLFIILFSFTAFLHSDSYVEEYQGFWFGLVDNVDYIESVSARILGNRIEFFRGICDSSGIFTGLTLVFVVDDYAGNFNFNVTLKGAIDHSKTKDHASLYQNSKILKYVHLRKKEIEGKTYLNIAFFDENTGNLEEAAYFYQLEYKSSAGTN